MRRVVRRDLLHVFALHRINFNSVGNTDNDVLHDLGALGHGAADLRVTDAVAEPPSLGEK